MTFIRLANFVEVYSVNNDGEETVLHRYQNAAPGTTIGYDGADYPYLSFIYQGAAKTRTGDNLQAALVLSTNEISQGIARELILDRDHARVYSVVMDTRSDSVNRTLTREDWLVATMTYDPATIEIILSSGIDAVGANAPTRVLTRKMVGHLPVTGSLRSG